MPICLRFARAWSELARSLGWLSAADQRAELMRMIGDRLAEAAVSSADVDLVCALNKDHQLDQELNRLQVPPAQADKVAHSAVLACLGSTEAHARVLRALSSSDDEEVQIAQIYLHHRPIADATELRDVAAAIARMNGSDAQVRALDTLRTLSAFRSREPGTADASVPARQVGQRAAGHRRDTDPLRLPDDRQGRAGADAERTSP